jgi:hypothetical protein
MCQVTYGGTPAQILSTPELLSYITQFLPDVQLPVYKKGGFGRKFVTTISFK